MEKDKSEQRRACYYEWIIFGGEQNELKVPFVTIEPKPVDEVADNQAKPYNDTKET
jgi:hypothetical protein